MGKQWTGKTWQPDGATSWWARWKDYGHGWRTSKGFERKADADDFLADKRKEYRARERGEWTDAGAALHEPIGEHLTNWIDHVRSGLRRRERRQTDKHCRQLRARIDKAFAKMNVRTLADLSLDKANRYLHAMLDTHSVKTRNDVMAALKQFGRWCVETEPQRLTRNPFELLRKVKDEDDRQQRQHLTWEQVRDLAAAAIQRHRQAKVKRPRDLDAARRRAMTLLCGFLAGLRNNEAANLRWSMIDHEAREIRLPHTITKSGRAEKVPLHAGLAAALLDWRGQVAAQQRRPVADSELVVGKPGARGLPTLPVHIVERIHEDAAWIKLPVIDGEGRRLDLHAIGRTSLVNELKRLGAHDGIVSDIVRHRVSSVTKEHYDHKRTDLLRPFLDLIPFEVVQVPGLFEAPGHTRVTYSVRAGEDRGATAAEGG